MQRHTGTRFEKQFSIFASGAFLLAVLSLGQMDARAEPPQQKQPDTTYPIRVEVREARNRVVEGKVRQHKLYVDQPKAFGADDTAPTPPETLAFALGSCVVSTGRLLAMQKNLTIKKLSAVVEGRLDFAKALGMSESKRAGFERLTITVSIDAPMTAEEKKQFLREVSARCPMCDNLVDATPLVISSAP